MAREEKPKTPFGARLIAARKALKFVNREALADALAIPKETLANYERGSREMPLALVSTYHQRFGVNLSWLITGDGNMFDDPSKTPAPTVQVDPNLLRQLHRAARLAYREAGHKPPDEDSLAIEAGELYNSLLAKISDVRNGEIVEAVIPILIKDLKTRLAEADAKPGTGKHSASGF